MFYDLFLHLLIRKLGKMAKKERGERKTGGGKDFFSK